jgi:hypothetical protein
VSTPSKKCTQDSPRRPARSLRPRLRVNVDHPPDQPHELRLHLLRPLIEPNVTRRSFRRTGAPRQEEKGTSSPRSGCPISAKAARSPAPRWFCFMSQMGLSTSRVAAMTAAHERAQPHGRQRQSREIQSARSSEGVCRRRS